MKNTSTQTGKLKANAIPRSDELKSITGGFNETKFTWPPCRPDTGKNCTPNPQ